MPIFADTKLKKRWFLLMAITFTSIIILVLFSESGSRVLLKPKDILLKGSDENRNLF